MSEFQGLVHFQRIYHGRNSTWLAMDIVSYADSRFDLRQTVAQQIMMIIMRTNMTPRAPAMAAITGISRPDREHAQNQAQFSHTF